MNTYRIKLVALLWWVLPGSSLAIGIGDMTVTSYINQPLQANIAVLQPDGLLESEVIASLASPDDFDRLDLERHYSLNALRFAADFSRSSEAEVDETLDISLDLEFQEAASPVVEEAEADTSGALDAEDPAETALDLALAYIDMGDKAGAAELLQTVLSSGDEAQREHAMSLLGSLE